MITSHPEFVIFDPRQANTAQFTGPYTLVPSDGSHLSSFTSRIPRRIWGKTAGRQSMPHRRIKAEYRSYQFYDDDTLLHPDVATANQRLMRHW